MIVDYDPLPAVPDMEAALEPDAPLLHEEHGSNVANTMGTGPVEGVLDDADVVVTQRIVNQRLAAVPMEPNGMIAVPGDPERRDDAVGLVAGPARRARRGRAGVLGLDPTTSCAARCAAVGGGFGPKQGIYVEFLLVAKAAQVLDRPVKWAETRSENMVAMGHGRAQVHYAELGVKRDGTIIGLRVRSDRRRRRLPGGRRVPAVLHADDVAAGVPNAEDRVQLAGGGDEHHTRRRVPRRRPSGGDPPRRTHARHRRRRARHRPGRDPPQELHPDRRVPVHDHHRRDVRLRRLRKPLDAVLENAGYDELRAEQAARPRARRHQAARHRVVVVTSRSPRPVGLYREWGKVEIEDDGTVLAYVGTSSHGQGHETAFSMIVSDVLGVPFEQITILQSDTKLIPQGGGTGGSRSLQIAGSALKVASDEVLTQAKQLAAHLFEANPDDIVLGDGGLQVAGVPARALSWADLASAVKDDDRRPESMEARLAHELTFDAGSSSFPFGAHIAVVEIDRETGRVELLRHIAVDDCGRIVNPLLVKGQQHGGIAQGVAQVLYEHVQYDEDANPVTANLMDYAMPSAAELPSYEVYNTETPSPLNPLGAKGIGESATIGSTPAVHNAVVDALSHLGIRHVDMPCTAERVWRAIQEAGAGDMSRANSRHRRCG